jgi:hypothetical protein
MAIITPHKDGRDSITVKTKQTSDKERKKDWWNAGSKRELCDSMLSNVSFLKQQNAYRYRQAAIYARLYGNMPLMGVAGSQLNRITTNSQALPIDRPTMSVITSCIDTLVSRLCQDRPRPIFLTDNGDYKQRTLAKQLTQFISGELYQTKAYELSEFMLRDACVLGTGVLKVLEIDKRVALERRLFTELLMDQNDALYGDPRQMFELKLIDRSVLMDQFPQYASIIDRAQQAYPDGGNDSSQTISDQIIVAEGWHLPSGKEAKDGLHTIVCDSGIIFEEDYKKSKFPFVFQHYSPRLLGPWGQGLAEQLMGTQVEINKLLVTISQAINLVGVPRVFVEDGSKVVKAHLNNSIGAIVTYRGTKPMYEVAPCVPAELYQQLQRLVEYAYQQSGISSLSAASQKPVGLDSGAALREYDDLQTDRFAALAKRRENTFIELAYQIIDQAKDIAERDGKYQTVFPDKNGVKEIDLPKASLLDDPFVIQCYDVSSLPHDPAGRLQKVTEMMQAGLISPQEGRRLLSFPDIDQEDKLANAAEERILMVLDDMVESSKYCPPDPWMPLDLAEQKVTAYINLYGAAKLEESKMQLLRNFFSQIQALKMAAQPPQPVSSPMATQPQASPEPAPTSELIPNVPGQPAMAG